MKPTKKYTPYYFLAYVNYGPPSPWLTPLGGGVVQVHTTGAGLALGLDPAYVADSILTLEEQSILEVLVRSGRTFQFRVRRPDIFLELPSHDGQPDEERESD